ncbi:MAG: FAD-binding oxidoreductase [bacterium]
MNPETELAAIVGAEGILNEACEAYAIDGKTPRWVVFPSTPEQVCRLVAVAQANNLKIAPFGSGSQIGIGAIPERIDLVISTKQLTDVTYYNAKDMTISVGAGMTLSALAEHVRADNLWFPVDPPQPDRVTIGGAVAANSNGPLRFRKGPLRDHVIGIQIVSPDGNLVKAGGKVVKNVAGYDMCKLYIGSLGTLGIVVEVTLKLASQPEAQAAIFAKIEEHTKTEEIISKIMNSSLDPIYLELITGNRARLLCSGLLNREVSTDRILAIGFDGGRAKVAWQTETAKEMIVASGSVVLKMSQDGEAFNDRAALAEIHNDTEADMLLKASILSSQVSEFIETVDSLAQGKTVEAGCAAHAGNGIVHVFLNGEDSHLISLAQDLLTKAVDLEGNLAVRKAPTHLKNRLEIWGKPSGAWSMMQNIRRKFDPAEMINPMRFISAA